jgi:hypothetical protein
MLTKFRHYREHKRHIDPQQNLVQEKKSTYTYHFQFTDSDMESMIIDRQRPSSSLEGIFAQTS